MTFFDWYTLREKIRILKKTAYIICFVLFFNMIESFLFPSHFGFVINLYSEFCAKVCCKYNMISILCSTPLPFSYINLLVSLQLLGIYLCFLQLFCRFKQHLTLLIWIVPPTVYDCVGNSVLDSEWKPWKITIRRSAVPLHIMEF